MGNDPTYYTVANAAYFPGVAALLNSLRLTGNQGELSVIDAGLTDAQRELLRPHARVVTVPPGTAPTPYHLKAYSHFVDGDGVVVIIDSDMIVTRHLTEAVKLAETGRLVVFPDHAEAAERWFAEWEQLFELKKPLRRGRHLNAGFVCVASDRWRAFLARWWEVCNSISPEHHFSRDHDQPLWAGDQDAFNALLLSEIPEGEVAVLPEKEAVLWDSLGNVEIVDERTLECWHRGVRTTLLHYSYRPKPWQGRSWHRVTDEAFVRLLPRVLFEPDVELRLDPSQFPFWSRPGRSGRATVRALDLGHRVAKAAINAPPAPVRQQLLALRNEFVYRLGR